MRRWFPPQVFDEWLENLAGCQIKNADAIIPAFQTTQPGDRVSLGPEGYPYYMVREMQPDEHIVLSQEDEGIRSVWAFVLREQPDGSTRLIVRSQTQTQPSVLNFILWRVITEPMHFIMEQKMLRGIKQRAEAAARN